MRANADTQRHDDVVIYSSSCKYEQCTTKRASGMASNRPVYIFTPVIEVSIGTKGKKKKETQPEEKGYILK